MRRFGLRAGLAGQQVRERRDRPAFEAAAGQHHLHPRPGHRLDRPRAGRRAGEYQTGREGGDDVAQLGVVLRQQRIGRRHRRVRNADPHRRQRQAEVVEVVVGQDGDRPLDRQRPLDQRLPDALHPRQHLRVADANPGPVGAALGDEGAVRRLARPVFEPVRQARRVRLQRFRRTQHEAAVGLALDRRFEAAADPDFAVAGHWRTFVLRTAGLATGPEGAASWPMATRRLTLFSPSPRGRRGSRGCGSSPHRRLARWRPSATRRTGRPTATGRRCAAARA